MKKVLITGGAGFIGSNLCKTLLDKGYVVIAVDNLITSSEENIQKLSHRENFTFIKHDVVNPFSKSLLAEIAGVDSIFHLACPTGVPNIETLGEEMIRTCSEGTRNVLEVARINKAKLLLTSSSEIYGDPLVRPQKETYTGNVDPIGLRSPYEEGKRIAETWVELYVRKYATDAKIVRIFNTYGPQMSMADSRVIPNFVASLKNGKPLTVQGEGLQKRTFCYVDDLIHGFITVIEKGKAGDVYNVGSDQEITIIELARLLSKLAGKDAPITFIDRPSHDHQQRLPDLEKIMSLGWKMNVTLEEGLKKTLQSYGM